MARRSGTQERSDAVAALMESHGSLRLRDAAQALNVTEMTLRRDATRPEAPFRVRGGWLVPAVLAPDYDLDREKDRRVEAKRAAARAALALVRPGARVFLDCGTTTTHLAQLLPGGQGISVVTHALHVAQIVAGRGDLPLTVLGGPYHAPNAAFHGDPAQMPAGLTLAILSAGGIAADGALSCAHIHEIAVKRAAMAAADAAWVLADSAKLGQTRPAIFGTLAEVTGHVTEAGICLSGSDEMST